MADPFLTDDEIERLRARLITPLLHRGEPVAIVAVGDVPWDEYVEIMRAEERARRAHFTALRRARIRRQLPKWADRDAIRDIYKRCVEISRQTGIDHQVDHEYPLAGHAVSGLHVAENLKIIPALDNARKRNRFTP